MTAIFKREFKAYFSSPIGYVILAVYFFFLGLLFSVSYSYGDPNITAVISGVTLITAFATPVLTMRLISEDRRQKVDQVLITSPVSLTGIVLGKFFAALSVFMLGFAPTVIFRAIIGAYVEVSIAAYLYALFGMLLLGAALISIGMFISSLTESPVISAILSIAVNMVIIYMTNFSQMTSNSFFASLFEKMAFIDKYVSFTENVFSIPDIVYFASIAAAFVFLTVRSMEKKRWS